jgi:protein-tyrosine phosphatase
MRGYIDLHCHWIAGIDDGAKTPEDGIEMLAGLYALGFSTVLATPHMRPGMFSNDKAALRAGFDAMMVHVDAARQTRKLPRTELASEHFFDETVFMRIMRGEGLPYPALRDPEQALQPPGARRRRPGILVEFPEQFPVKVADRFDDLIGQGLLPVLAHPERYRPVWKDDRCLDPLLDVGASLLLDVCALVGKYGSAAEKAAHKLLEDEAYEAACSDAHRPSDIEIVAKALTRLEELVGKPEAERLLTTGPLAITG